MTSRAAREDAEALLAKWPDERLVAVLLSYLYRLYDAGGISVGRSWESALVEPALRLMDTHRPSSDVTEWPTREEVIREAEDRIRRRAVMDFEREAAEARVRALLDSTHQQAEEIERLQHQLHLQTLELQELRAGYFAKSTLGEPGR